MLVATPEEVQTMLNNRNFDRPDDTKDHSGKGKMELVNVGSVTAGKGVFQPGWKWSNDAKPVMGGDSCQASHAGYVVSGRMKIVMNDGAECEVGPGEIMVASPGHDAWVVGDEPCVLIDFGSSVKLG
jgi:hypothetical protein